MLDENSEVSSNQDNQNGGAPRREFLTLLVGGTAGIALFTKGGISSIDATPQLVDSAPLANTSFLSQASILDDGWRVTGVLPGLAPGGVAPKTGWGYMPNFAALAITGPGWNDQAQFNAATPRIVRCNLGVKRMWQLGVAQHDTVAAAPYVLNASGSDLQFEFASSNFIYQKETVNLVAREGWFNGAAAVPSLALANSSAVPFAKAMIDWLEPLREHVTGTFKVRLTGGFHVEARNGRPLAAVKITGTTWDPVTNAARMDSSPVTRAAVYEWSGASNQPGLGSAVWSAEFSEADFPQGGLVRFTFEDFPWVGDETAQRCKDLVPSPNPRTTALAFQSQATSIAFGIHGIVKWVGPIPGQRHVYVVAPDSKMAVRGDDSTAKFQASMELAKAAPFASFAAAWNALFDPKKGGSTDASGATVWLSDGSHALPATGNPAPSLQRSATDVPITIRSDPSVGASAANCILGSTGNARFVLYNHYKSIKTSFVMLRDLTLTVNTGMLGTICGSGSTRPTSIYFDNCIVDDQTMINSSIFSGGSIISARYTFFKSKSKISYLDAINTNSISIHFHNCASEILLRGTVIWGASYPGTYTGAPLKIGAGPTSYIRNRNLVVGYVYVPDWQPPDNVVFIFLSKGGTPVPVEEDWGISVAYCRTAGKRFNNTRFSRTGELVDQSYRNFVVEGITMTREADPGVANSGGGGFNFHNDPRTRPSKPPGNDYDRCVVRNSSLARMAVKGDVFYSRVDPVAAKFLTGGRASRHGVGMHGLIVGTCATANSLNVDGLCSVWGGPSIEYQMTFANEAAKDFRPVSGFVPLPAELVGHGFDLNGDRLFLDGTDAPGAFRRVVMS